MRLTRFAICSLGMLGLLLVTETAALASVGGPVPVPEIDGASIAGGVCLLAAGVMIVRARWGRK